MSYSPPHGDRVGLDFAGAYEIPAGNRAGLEFAPREGPVGDTQYLFPTAFDSLDIGAFRVWLGQRWLKPDGLDTLTVSLPRLDLWSRYLGTNSWQSSNVGQPAIRNRNFEVKGAGAFSALAMGTAHSVYLYTRYLRPGGVNAALYGTQRVEHGVRRANVTGVDQLGMGTAAWVSRSPRELAPTGIKPPDIMESHIVGGLRYVFPVGTEMTQWGERIIPLSQTIGPQGFVSVVGTPAVQNMRSYVRPQGFQTSVQEQLRWGVAQVWNLRHIVQQNYDPNDGLNPPPFGQWTEIENRNKTPVTVGWLSERHGYTQIDNKARVMQPGGIAPPSLPDYEKTGSVTHGVRSVPAEGIDSLVMPSWAAVYNAADVVSAQGAAFQAFGVASLINRSRVLPRVGGDEHMAMGMPMIASAIRGISFESRYSIEPPQIDLPEVKLYTRRIEQVSMGDMSGAGSPELVIRWTVIEPKWTHRDFVGQPALRNLTPELRTGGANHEEFGAASVRTQWREVIGQGTDMQLFGQARVADRRNWVFLTGLVPPAIPRPVVTKVGGLPEAQNLVASGIAPPDLQVSRPTLNLLFAYPGGFETLRFGAAVVTANSIRVEPGIWDHLIGEPEVSLKNRTLDVGGIDAFAVPGTPRVSPHTIYAVVEAPDQAKANHGAQGLHYVDFDTSGRSLKGIGQNTKISHFVQTARAAGVNTPDNQLPPPVVFNRKHYINTTGVHTLRVGMPSVPGPQFMEQFDGPLTQAFGAATVKRPPYTGPQTVAPSGFAGAVGAGTRVEHFNRSVEMTGWDSQAMGASRPGDTPYTWQGLRIGPLMPTIPSGFNAERHGTAWISHRVRGLALEGFDSFACEYDYQAFQLRMRVRRGSDAVKPPVQGINPAGVAPLMQGAHDVRPGVHFIRPDGNSDQFRKGVPV